MTLGEVKRSNIIEFQLPCQFQRFFLSNFVCVLTNERYKTYQKGFSSVAWVMAPGSDLGGWGCQGGQNFFFSNMVMWHIKSTGMTSRTECK